MESEIYNTPEDIMHGSGTRVSASSLCASLKILCFHSALFGKEHKNDQSVLTVSRMDALQLFVNTENK